MRFILFLFVALGLTMVWQSSTLAAGPVAQPLYGAEDAGGKDQKSDGNDKAQGAGDQEPDCD
jgi:hypothetical protein